MVRPARPSVTARWVAVQRARLHDQRATIPTGDPDAELQLYRGFSRGFAAPGLRPTGMVLRTRFIDDEVLRAMSTGVSQFVLIGAGYDGRALRFRQPGVTWFELDHSATQPDKQRRVREAAKADSDIRYAPVDLVRDDVRAALHGSGHDAGRPSLFICEGLFTYLPNEVVNALCSRLRDVAAPASVVVVSTLVVPAAHRGKPQVVVDCVLRMLGERRMGVFHPGDVESTLADSGWTVCRRATSRAARRGGSHVLLIAAEAGSRAQRQGP